eukprot:TRINITY_DN3736_c0_g3_i1.p1 TRINITY_DN3736_c0_g3~~TRINITY_DN3736_c0_g3_i1.p1  ORF type:complete len:707 (-),score=150.88 TRINITY_DN3736_c0_g3_i1:81-2201(-)
MTFATPNSTSTYRALKQLQFKELFSNFVLASTGCEQIIDQFSNFLNFLSFDGEGVGERRKEALKNVGRVYSGVLGWLLMELKTQKLQTRLDRRWRLVLKDETWPEIVVRFTKWSLRNSDIEVDQYEGIIEALENVRWGTANLNQHGIILRYLCDQIMESESFREEVLGRQESAEEMTRETRDLVTEDKRKLKQMMEEERELKRIKREKAVENAIEAGSNNNSNGVVNSSQMQGINNQSVVSADIRIFFKPDQQDSKLDLPEELQQFQGDPNDKKALIDFRQRQQVARKELQVMQARLDQQRREQLRQQQKEEREMKDREKQRENMKESMSRHQENLENKLEKLIIRYSSLGADRYHRRYWWGLGAFHACVFVENIIDNKWGVYCSMEEIDNLIDSLEERGEREKELKEALERRYEEIEQQFKKSLTPPSQVSVKQASEHNFSIPERLQPSRRAKASSYANQSTTEVFVEAAKEGFLDRFKIQLPDGLNNSCFVLVIEQINKQICLGMDSGYPEPDGGWEDVLEGMVDSVNAVDADQMEGQNSSEYESQLLNILRKVLIDLEDHLVTSSGYQFRSKKKSEAGSDDEDDQSQADEEEMAEQEDGSSVAATTSMSGVNMTHNADNEWVDNEDERSANRHQKKPRKIPWYSIKERNSWRADVLAAKTAPHLAYCSSVFYLYSKPIFAFYEPPPPKPEKSTRCRQWPVRSC